MEQSAESLYNQHSLKCIQTVTKALKSFNKPNGDVIIGDVKVASTSLIDYITVLDFAVEINLQ